MSKLSSQITYTEIYMKKKIVIGGYYGYGSLGDEAVLSVLIQQLKDRYPDYEITVLCASPAKMKQKYGVRCVHRYDGAAIIREFSRAELYISGGGSLIQDATSVRSLRYYCSLIRMAKSMGLKVYAYANGIGPLRNSDLARSALSACDAVSVRDSASFEMLDRMGIQSTLSADPFFLYDAASKSDVRRFLCDRGIYTDKYFTVSLRRCRGKKQIDEDAFLRILLPHIASGEIPIYISMQDKCDLALSAAMADITGGYVVTPTDASILLGLQRDADFAIGMRLHFLLAAAVMGTPLAALSYDDKIDNVLRYCAGISSYNAFEIADEFHDFDSCLSRDYSVRRDAMRSLAERDIDSIGALLHSEGELVKA